MCRFSSAQKISICLTASYGNNSGNNSDDINIENLYHFLCVHFRCTVISSLNKRPVWKVFGHVTILTVLTMTGFIPDSPRILSYLILTILFYVLMPFDFSIFPKYPLKLYGKNPFLKGF